MRYIYFLLFFTVFISCDKEEPPIDNPGDGSSFETSKPYSGPITDISISDTTCFNFYISTTSGIYIDDTIIYNFPRLNYNNDNQFVYEEENTVTGENKLIVYNLASQQKTIIKSNCNLTSQPDWKDGQIVFTQDEQLKIMNESGGNLQNIASSSVSAFNPIFRNDMSSVIYNQFDQNSLVLTTIDASLTNPNDISQINSQKISFTGPVLHALNISTSNKLLMIKNDFTIHSHNFQTNSSAPLIKIAEELAFIFPYAHCWSRLENGVIYFSANNNMTQESGLYKLDMINYTLEKLITYCTSKSYTNISVSSNDEFMIGERIIIDTLYENNPYSNRRISKNIYKIDLHTLEETKINL